MQLLQNSLLHLCRGAHPVGERRQMGGESSLDGCCAVVHTLRGDLPKLGPTSLPQGHSSSVAMVGHHDILHLRGPNILGLLVQMCMCMCVWVSVCVRLCMCACVFVWSGFVCHV